MIQNYFKTAFRSLLKGKVFTLINIFGLAIGMSVCLLIIMLIKDAYSFDTFHPQTSDVYRINTTALRKSGGTENYASTPMPVGKTLQEQYPGIEKSVVLTQGLRGEALVGDKRLNLTGLLTDGTFFDVFGFELAKGNPATVLAEPYSIVLTDATAKRFFDTADPIGQTIDMSDRGIFTVTGVLKPFPGKTHLEFEALGSLASLAPMERERGSTSPLAQNWNNYYFSYNYVRLEPGTNPKEIEQALDAISQEQYADLELESRDKGYDFYLQPLRAITPGPILSNNMGRALPAAVLIFLSVLGGIVLVSACFNYTNLTIARAFNRTKEIGVRKVTGATRWQVIVQFLVESVLVAVLALGIGYLLLKLIMPMLQSLEFMSFIDLPRQEDIALYAWFLLFAVLTGLVAGLLPSLLLSRVKPVVVLQRLENLKLIKSVGLRKVFIVLQFALSLLFVFLITAVYEQSTFAINRDYGFDWDGVVNVPLQGESYTALSQEFAKLNFVNSVSGASHNMGTWEDSSIDIRKNSADDPQPIRDYAVDENFIQTFDLELVAGDNFTRNTSQERESFVIVNEQFVKRFDLGEPGDAVGQPIILEDSTQVAILGVVKDFNYKPVDYQLEPMLLRYDPDRWSVLNVKITGTDVAGAVSGLESAWQNVVDDHAFEYMFYDDIIRNTYSNFRDLMRLLGFFAVLALTIACLGMLGMAVYTMQSKAKEVSIRKVFGASFRDLFLHLSKSFAWLMLIAIIIAVPLGFLLNNLFLESFAYRISMTPMLFLPGILAIGLLAFLIVGSQVVRAAIMNPINALREE